MTRQQGIVVNLRDLFQELSVEGCTIECGTQAEGTVILQYIAATFIDQFSYDILNEFRSPRECIGYYFYIFTDV